jgi:hypothetical protein
MNKQGVYLLGCIAAFVGLFVVAWIRSGQPNYGALEPALILSPIFPAIGVGFFLARSLGALDELQQRIQLESLAFSLANTLLVALALGLLLRFETPNMAWVLPIAVVFYAIGFWMARRRYR